jgi:sulfur carrier protein ThiS
VINITVILHTIYQVQTSEGPVGKLELTIENGKTIAAVLKHMGISFHAETGLLVVNGKNVGLNHHLSNGDELHLIAAISGGAM